MHVAKAAEVLGISTRKLGEELLSGRLTPQLTQSIWRYDHLYVVELVGFGSKFGITSQPRQRLRQLAGVAAKRGWSVGRSWVSIRHREATVNERAIARALGVRTEYVTRPYEEVVALAQGLPMTGVE